MPAASQMGIAIESVFGTYAAPTAFFEFVDEALKFDRERIESRAWRAGQRVISSSRWKQGRKMVDGPITLEVANKGFGKWFLNMLGAVAITTPGGSTTARKHAYTLGALVGDSLTIQIGREFRGGTVQAFSYLGCKVSQWSLACAIGELLTLGVTIVGRDEDTAQTLGTASYPSAQQLFTFVEGTITLATVATPIRSITIDGDNQLPSDDFQLGSALRRDPLEPALRKITGTMDADFTSLVAYNRFTGGTEAALDLLFDTGTLIDGTTNFKVNILANVRFDGETPSVSGPEEVRQNLPFAVTAPASGEPFELDYFTTDTAS